MVKNIVFGLDGVLIKTYRFRFAEVSHILYGSYLHKLLFIRMYPELVDVIFPNDNGYNNNYLTNFIIDDYWYVIFYRPKIDYLFNALIQDYKLMLYTSHDDLFVSNVINGFNKLLKFSPFSEIFCNNFFIKHTSTLKHINIYQHNTLIVDVDNEFIDTSCFNSYVIKKYDHEYKQIISCPCIPMFNYNALLDDNNLDSVVIKIQKHIF